MENSFSFLFCIIILLREFVVLNFFKKNIILIFIMKNTVLDIDVKTLQFIVYINHQIMLKLKKSKLELLENFI